MLKRLTPRDILAQLSLDWQGELRDAWLEAISGITSAVTLRSLIAEIERGNVQGALRMLDISPDRFARFERAIIGAWDAGGAATVAGMPALRDPSGNRIVFSWGVRNLPAEQYIRNHAASLVDDLVGEQVGIARQILSDGLSRGVNPRQTAIRLIGKVDPRTGLRSGGILGNSPSVVERLDRIYAGLRAGDPEAMKAYLSYQLRDKRFDGHVRRALAEGGSVPAQATDRIVTAYSNRALRHRAENLALTETNVALAQARADAFQQQIDAGKLEAQDMTKTWGRTISKEPREDHAVMVGVTIPFNEMFTLPDGTQCEGPHDPNLPVEHLVGCKCDMTVQIDFTAQALRRYQERVGG